VISGLTDSLGFD